MNRRYWLSLLLPLLLSPGCSQPPSRDMPSSLIWDKDQTRISPADGAMNVWEGFRIENDHFSADRNFSRFILWRRNAANVAVQVDYALQGNPVKFATNGAQRKRLSPSREFRQEKFDLKLFENDKVPEFSQLIEKLNSLTNDIKEGKKKFSRKKKP